MCERQRLVFLQQHPGEPHVDLGGCWLSEVNKGFLDWTWSVLRRFYFI